MAVPCAPSLCRLLWRQPAGCTTHSALLGEDSPALCTAGGQAQQSGRRAVQIYLKYPPVAVVQNVAVQVAISNPRNLLRKQYKFDKVFGPESTQEQVYEDTKALIRSVLDGGWTVAAPQAMAGE